MCYNDRHPKPPTPEQVKLPTPPALPTPPPEAANATGADGTVPTVGVDGVVTEGAVAVNAAQVAGEPVAEVPKGPPPPPPPFDYFLDLPAEGAEVPFVKNYVPPPPEPEPVAIREDGLPTCNFISSFASHHVGVASDCVIIATTETTIIEVAPATEATPVTEATPSTDAPADATPAATEEPKPETAPAATS